MIQHHCMRVALALHVCLLYVFGLQMLLHDPLMSCQCSCLSAADMGPGPPLFEANVPFRQGSGALSGPLRSISGPLRAPSGTLLQSFRQRFRPSSEAAWNGEGASTSFGQSSDMNTGVIPLHTSDGVVPGGLAVATINPVAAEAVVPTRSFFRSPFADWTPSTGLANDTRDSNSASVEMSRAHSSTRRL